MRQDWSGLKSGGACQGKKFLNVSACNLRMEPAGMIVQSFSPTFQHCENRQRNDMFLYRSDMVRVDTAVRSGRSRAGSANPPWQRLQHFGASQALHGLLTPC
jgi:hypothetical protein